MNSDPFMMDRDDLDSLKEFISARFTDLDNQLSNLKQYFEAIIAERDKAVKEAIRVLEFRLDGLNELRRTVEADRNLLLTKDKYDSEHGALENRVTSLEAWRGKAALIGTLGVFVGGLIGAAIMRLFTGLFGS
jgi:hypothetical protein